MSDSFARIASFALAGVFLWAGVAKLLGYERWRAVVARYGLPRVIAAASTPLVPLLEIAIAVVIVFGSARAGSVLALAVLCLFSLAVMRARSLNGDKLPCGCFGGREERHYSTMLWRNFLLALLAAIVLRGAQGSALSGSSAPGRADAVPFVLMLLGAVLAGWMLWQVGTAFRRREHP